MTRGPLVDAAWLRERLEDPGLAVVDCRWRLGEPGEGERDYLAGHVPGAAFLDVDSDLAAPPGEGGRHPLPNAGGFQAAARRAGISDSSLVVAYGAGAARLWWLLRHFGHDNVAVLEEWDAPWRQGAEEIEPGDFTARPRADDTVTADRILAGDYALVDARAPERFRGEVEPIDPVAGRIPGARTLAGAGCPGLRALVRDGAGGPQVERQCSARSTSSRSSGPGGRRSR